MFSSNWEEMERLFGKRRRRRKGHGQVSHGSYSASVS